jgi:5-(carboxyamino)imidazole ribonucleotide synthase
MASSPPSAPSSASAPGAAIPPGAWLGLLGGGQLGRMFCMAAQSLGYRVAVLDPGDHSPAGTVADRHLAADYLDPQGLAVVTNSPEEFGRVVKADLDRRGKIIRDAGIMPE